MMYAADFRAAARRALAGKWFLAVVAGLIASLLGGASSGGAEFKINFDTAEGLSFQFGGITLFSDSSAEALGWLMVYFIPILLSALALSLVFLALRSVIRVGYAQFNLNLVDNREVQLGDLLAHVSNFKTVFIAQLLVGLYTFLWTLLLIIPGIMASYSYAMVPYLLAEYPDMTASEAITYSKDMMVGNRWRLFCLHFSFLGWSILCGFTLGIGYLWLVPYEEAAQAAFYRELTRTPDPTPAW